MEKDLENLFSTARRQRLSVSEKEEIWTRLRSATAVQGAGYRGTFLWRMLSTGFSHYTPLVATVMIFVLMGAGAALAENAVPGDALYPLKRVTERVRSTVHFTPESKAENQAVYMDRRVDEATLLNTRGELTEEASVELDNEYRRERRELLKNVKVMEQEGNETAAGAVRAKAKATEDRYERLFKGARHRQPDAFDESLVPQAEVGGAVKFDDKTHEQSSSSSHSAKADLGADVTGSAAVDAEGVSASVNGEASVNGNADLGL